ncbi:MAG: cupredoxin domain-containing protein [Myxococcales bacterium]|nr:cupredoxin domain-containing protein [Myxococcales bacterium]
MKTLIAIALFLTATACNKAEKPGQAAASAAPTGPSSGTINVKADENGFAPSSISLKKGEAATLRFTRTSDETCATKVVFPELKLEKELPLNQPVEVAIDTKEAKTVGFECGMGMYKSKVVIE